MKHRLPSADHEARHTLAKVLRLLRKQRTPLERQRSILAVIDEGYLRPPFWGAC